MTDACGTKLDGDAFFHKTIKEMAVKGLVAWFLGVPVFVIILLYILGIF